VNLDNKYYRIMVVLKVETDNITIGLVVILVIMNVVTFKTDVIVFIGNITTFLTSHFTDNFQYQSHVIVDIDNMAW
jgi:hypothetical protein